MEALAFYFLGLLQQSDEIYRKGLVSASNEVKEDPANVRVLLFVWGFRARVDFPRGVMAPNAPDMKCQRGNHTQHNTPTHTMKIGSVCDMRCLQQKSITRRPPTLLLSLSRLLVR